MEKKRETQKQLEIEGRTFKIKKLDPLLGNYILMKVTTMIMPFGLSQMVGEKMGKPLAAQSSREMTKADFLELQRDILGVCFEVLPAGEAEVVRADGTYGIGDFTASLAMQLLTASLAFNFADFFGESLSTLTGGKESPSN